MAATRIKLSQIQEDGASNGDILTFDGTQWAPAPPSGAGGIYGGSGTVASLALATVPDNFKFLYSAGSEALEFSNAANGVIINSKDGGSTFSVANGEVALYGDAIMDIAAEDLTIAGNNSFNLAINGVYGDVNQVLTAQGDGTAIWADPTGADGNGIYDGSGTIPVATTATLATGATFDIAYSDTTSALTVNDAGSVALSANGADATLTLNGTSVVMDAAYVEVKDSDGAATPGELRLYEASSNGTSYTALKATSLTANRALELPDASGTLLVGSGLANHVALWTADGVLDYDTGITYSASDNAINVSNMGIGVAYNNALTEPIQIKGAAAAGAQGLIFRFSNSGGSYAGSIGYANNPSDLAFISRTGITVFDLSANTLQLYREVTHGSSYIDLQGRADVTVGGVVVQNRASGQGTPGTYPLFVVKGAASGQNADLQQWKHNTTVKSIVNKDGYFVIGGSSLDATAALQVDSTTKGILFPRMTTTERDAISTPPDGLTLYNTTTDKFTVRANGAWAELASGASYTDEEAQDAVGNILVDGTTIDFTYSDATPSITAEVASNSISNTYLTSGTGGIYKGSGTIAAGAVATVTASSLFKVNYSTANPAIQVDDADNSTTIFSDSGAVYAYVNDSTIDLRSDIIKLGGGTSAAELRFLEPSGSGSNYTAFKAQAQASDITYTLPATNADGYMKNTSGTLSWDSTGIILDGGNTNGATVTIGTNDANALELETNNVTRLSITGGASTGGAVTVTNVTSNTNTVQDILTLRTNSTGTAAASFGGAILFQGESSTTDNQDMARISAV